MRWATWPLLSIGGPSIVVARRAAASSWPARRCGPSSEFARRPSDLSIRPGRTDCRPDDQRRVGRPGRGPERDARALERAFDRERRFVDDASHELRTPLAILKAELDIALRRARGPDELLQVLHSASEEADRLARLAEDLLVLGQSEDGRLPVRREVDVSRLVNDAVSGFTGQAKPGGSSWGSRSLPARGACRPGPHPAGGRQPRR